MKWITITNWRSTSTQLNNNLLIMATVARVFMGRCHYRMVGALPTIKTFNINYSRCSSMRHSLQHMEAKEICRRSNHKMRIRWGSGGSTWQARAMGIRVQARICQTIVALSPTGEGHLRGRMLVGPETSQSISVIFTTEFWAMVQQSVAQVLQIYNWTILNRIECSYMAKQFLQKILRIHRK